MNIDTIRTLYAGARAYHAIWGVEVFETKNSTPVESFSYSVTFFNGSCAVVLSDAFCSFYALDGQQFDSYYGRAVARHYCSDPDRFISGLIGVSHRFAQLLPAWFFSCSRAANNLHVAVLPCIMQAEQKLPYMQCGAFVVVPTDDNKIAYAACKGYDFFVTFIPSYQTLMQ